MDSYTQQRIDLVRLKTGASDVHYDLLGVTLTIDGQVIVLAYDVVRALSHLILSAESEAVDKLRNEMHGGEE
jgi:hypothetical protein